MFEKEKTHLANACAGSIVFINQRLVNTNSQVMQTMLAQENDADSAVTLCNIRSK